MNPFELATRIKETTGEFPPIPQIAAEVLRITSSGEAIADELAKLISRDPALTSRVLKLANSSFYARGSGVRNVRQAIMSVGFKAIRSLVLTASFRGLVPTLGARQGALWEHSIGCGLAARILASHAGFEDPEQAYVAGLLHDVGKTVLLLRLPGRMGPIVDRALTEPGFSFREQEEEAFGFDHAALGQLLAREWKLDRETEEAIGAHHCPGEAKTAPLLSHLVGLSNALCHRLAIGPTKRPELCLSDHECTAALGLEDAALESAAREMREKFDAERASLME